MSTAALDPDPLLVDCPVCLERSGTPCRNGMSGLLLSGSGAQYVHTGRRMRARRLSALPAPASALDVGAWLRGGS